MKLRPVKDVAVDNPGLFHYTLVPKEVSLKEGERQGKEGMEGERGSG